MFVLRAVGNCSIVACYHGLSHRLGLILKHGEQRVGYLTQEMRSLIAAQDEVGSLPEPAGAPLQSCYREKSSCQGYPEYLP